MSHRLLLAVCAAIIATTAYISYGPALDGDFLWDDDVWIEDNELLVAPDGLQRIWFSIENPSQYFPMVYTTLRWNRAIHGLDPYGFHVTNLALHILNAWLFWWLLTRIGVRGGFWAALLFVLHPIQVESVAWMTERKNVLSLFFILISLSFWYRHVERTRWVFFALSLGAYALALFSKTTACTLPAAFVLILWWKRIPLNLTRWAEIAPYVVFGLVMGSLTVWWELDLQGLDHTVLSPELRPLVASRALLFYVGKFFLPIGLAFSYPTWTIDPSAITTYLWPMALLAIVFATIRFRDKLGRGPIAASLYFAATLSPMLGLIPLYTFRYSYVADHYVYVATLGPLAVLGALLARLPRQTGIPLGLALAAILGALTWNQSHAYQSKESLWRDTIRKNPESVLAHNSLGVYLHQSGRLEEGRGHLEEAVRLRPGDAQNHSNLGSLYADLGDLERAIEQYELALEADPNRVIASYNLGRAYMSLRRYPEAERMFRRTLAIKPDYAKALNDLGSLALAAQREDDAMELFQQAVDADPELAEAQFNLAHSYHRRGEFARASRHYHRTLQIRPDLVDAHYALGVVEEAMNRGGKALNHYRRALELNPKHEDAARRYERLVREGLR